MKFKLIKNKQCRPYEYSVTYKDSVILHIPDYLSKKIIKEIIQRLNKNPLPLQNFEW